MRPALLVALATLLACAPKTTPAPAVAAAEAQPAATPEARELLLWEVRKGDAVSHLLGTCHIHIPLDHALPEPYDQHLREARVLVSELDIDAMLDPIEAVKIAFDPEVDLLTLLGPEDFAALSVHLRAAMPASALVHSPPWVVAPMLGSVGKTPTPGAKALDQYVAQVAEDSGVPSAYLETADEQLAMMASLQGDFIDVLRSGSDASAAHFDASRLAVQACVDGDLAPFEEMLADPEAAESTRRMFDVRNEAWRDRVVAEAEQGGAFVAVGAGHMIRETGLVAQLEAAGFTVTRLQTEAPATADAAKLTDFAEYTRKAPAADTVDAWMAQLGAPGAFIERLCAEGELVRTCYVPDAAACTERVTADLQLCVEQLSHDLPAAPEPASLQAVLGCGMSGVGIEALATGTEPTEPVCIEVREGMLAAMEAMLATQR